MYIKVIGTGSSGNGYVIETSDWLILLEAGMKPQEMLDAIDYETSKVSGCFISHEHIDHAKYAKKYSMYGFSIYASAEVSDRISQVYGTQIKSLKRMKKNHLDGLTVVPFKVPHNETECDGFLFEGNEIGKLLFMTDLELCPYNFHDVGINHVIVECNYSTKYVKMDDGNKEHVFKGHMEMETCKRFLQTVNTENLRSVGLVHLSSEHADKLELLDEISKILPDNVLVWVAEKGKKVEV